MFALETEHTHYRIDQLYIHRILDLPDESSIFTQYSTYPMNPADSTDNFEWC